LLSGDTSTKSSSNSFAIIKAFFNSRTPTCTPSGAITLSSLDFISSLILSSGMLIPFHKKNGTKPFV